jgi:hypothetical protein
MCSVYYIANQYQYLKPASLLLLSLYSFSMRYSLFLFLLQLQKPQKRKYPSLIAYQSFIIFCLYFYSLSPFISCSRPASWPHQPRKHSLSVQTSERIWSQWHDRSAATHSPSSSTSSRLQGNSEVNKSKWSHGRGHVFVSCSKPGSHCSNC